MTDLPRVVAKGGPRMCKTCRAPRELHVRAERTDIEGKAELARALDVTLGRVNAWVREGMPHGLGPVKRGRPALMFSRDEIAAWLDARSMQVLGVNASGSVAYVKVHGPAHLTCEVCRLGGRREQIENARTERLGPHHRAYARWREPRGRSTPVLTVIVECGLCWHVLMHKRAEKVLGADRVPVRETEKEAREALFA